MDTNFVNFLVIAIAVFCLIFYIIPYLRRLMRGNVIYIEPKDLFEKIKSGGDLLMIDIRPGLDFTDMTGHIEGSISIPFNVLSTRLLETADKLASFKKTPIVLIGMRDENKVFLAYKDLKSKGFTDVCILNYGITQWLRHNFPTVERNAPLS